MKSFRIYQDRIAKAVSRSGKNEIQFYKIDASGQTKLTGSVFLDHPVLDFKFNSSEHDEHVSKTKPASRKRVLNGGAAATSKTNSADAETLLGVVLQDASVVILSADSNSIMHTQRFHNGNDKDKDKDKSLEFSSIVRYASDTMWCVTKSRDLVKFNPMASAKLSKVAKLPKSNTICMSGEYRVCLGTGNSVESGKIVKDKYVKTQIFPSVKGEIVQIELLDAQTCVVLTADGHGYVVPLDSATLQRLETEDTIEKISIVRADNEQYIIAITVGAKLDIFTSDGRRINSISVPSSLRVECVISVDNQPMVRLGHDDHTSMQFQPFALDQTRVDVQNGAPTPESNGVNSSSIIRLPDGEDGDGVSRDLYELLSSSTLDKSESHKLCKSKSYEYDDDDDDDEKIKKIVSKLSREQSEKLFTVVSEQVSQDVTANFRLNVWLKWLLLIHGGNFARSNNVSVKSLQNQLEAGLKVLPRLYAIKGKLQLLKLQSELKSSAPLENNDVTTTVEDESMMYANGEVDDTPAPE
ncbi:uncharacterized protein LODBEIA_P32330 [Lodderomyces beijingensis]|uniref:Small-subunit processome Utp12 domain-containing protein n=1 Tax=Lodderomyces beijingensis TaxID=1775926 RepID=A0ABP0ZLI9_9ASCO